MEVSNLGIQGSEVGHGGRLTEKCPRCSSMNTKFCYFNNYSLTQPRHYCKTCRRYWTQGGVFRNIPVGGATYRRNRRAALGPFVRYTTRRRGRPARSRVAISVSGGPVAVSGGGGSGGGIMSSSIGTDFPDPFETRVSEFRRSVSCFGPMPILSATAPNLSLLHYEISANNNNFVNFPSCQSENLLTSLDPTDHMFLWGLDDPTGSGSSDGNQSDRPPPLPDFDDIDVINDQWTEEDLPRYTPPPPPPPPPST